MKSILAIATLLLSLQVYASVKKPDIVKKELESLPVEKEIDVNNETQYKEFLKVLEAWQPDANFDEKETWADFSEFETE